MATPLEICNSALRKLGAKTISALSDTSKEGLLCNGQYYLLRDQLIRSHDWVFLRTSDDWGATERSASDVTTWTYMFTKPAAAARIARIRHVTDLDDNLVAYENIDGKIYCDEEDIRVRYVKTYSASSPTNPDTSVDYPADFSEALACYLAADLCVSLQQNQSLRDTYLQQFNYALSQARFNGAVELGPQASTAGDWLESREGLNRFADPDMRGLAGY